MVKYEIKFEILGLPPTGNSLLRGGWRIKHGNAKKWKKRVGIALLGKKLPTSPLTKARIVLTRLSCVRTDYDNRVSSFKPIIDGLVEHQVLAGDTEDFIGIPEYLYEKAPRGSGRIRIEVYEI